VQQRYYDPGIGRTLSRDPVTAYSSGDLRHFNVYAYAYNNPYRFKDLDGRKPVDDGPDHRPGRPPVRPTNNPPPPPPPPDSKPRPDAQSSDSNKKSNLERAREIASEELAKHHGHNNADDAQRHADWNRRMSEEIGPFTSWAVGTGHEVEGLLNGGPLNEARMDLHNNAEGRDAASEGRAVDPRNLRTSPEQTDGAY
jgi:hypothetical protein